ncbi:helix-turn-helix domain-containing protein [Lentzea albida]|uniref:Helix-turn-helix domain-containing protein n=1 Tax=Lentzea albida TaxID=65499 RepID=A0A1H9X0N9_9PSEU|nr:helix-turn-helix transcriptional regulator [Lentzea albida]SES39601.1 Helix-turn-helix domain-containing protein [Lentzea albida]
MPQRSSTARGREFGAGVRAAIKASGMSARRVAELVGWQEAKLSDFLNGKIGCTETELALLLGLCRTPIEERDHLLDLRPATHVRGWWQKHAACPPVRLRTLVENVAVAKTLTTWHPHGLPVYLQTQDYMRAVIAASPNLQDGETDQRLQAGQELQEFLFRRDLQCTFYVHEQALHLPVGGHEAHVGQVHHLLLTAVRTNVAIRIVPTAAGAYANLSGAFTRLTFPTYEPLVFLELEGSVLIEEQGEAVKRYQEIVRSLASVSLNEERSKAVLLRVCEQLAVGGSENGHVLPGALAAGVLFRGSP